MITPSPTAVLAPHLARGVLESVADATPTRPAHIVMSVPNTSYQIHLRPVGEIKAAVGKRLIGTIAVEARRIDRVGTGGVFLEPVFGRPRRVQGRVVAIDPAGKSIGDGKPAIIVDAGVPVHLIVAAPNQSADQFKPGEIVSCDVHDGATFAETRND